MYIIPQWERKALSNHHTGGGIGGMFRSACAPRTMERCENLCPSPGAASGVDAPAIPALPSASAPSCTLWSNTISSTIGFSLLPPPCPHRFQCDAPLFAPFFYLTHFFLQVLPCAWLLRRLSRECRLAIADAATLKSLAALVPPTGEHVVRYSGVVFGGGGEFARPINITLQIRPLHQPPPK